MLFNTTYSIWKRLRRTIKEKRLYRYGTCGLSVFDDRSLLEKVLDYVDGIFFNIDQKRRYRHSRLSEFFKPVFDWSTGKWMRNLSDIRAMEKTGKVYCNIREWEELAAKKKKYREDDSAKHIAKRLNRVMEDINNGRRFTEESKNNRRAICEREGIAKLPGYNGDPRR